MVLARRRATVERKTRRSQSLQRPPTAALRVRRSTESRLSKTATCMLAARQPTVLVNSVRGARVLRRAAVEHRHRPTPLFKKRPMEVQPARYGSRQAQRESRHVTRMGVPSHVLEHGARGARVLRHAAGGRRLARTVSAQEHRTEGWRAQSQDSRLKYRSAIMAPISPALL